MTRGPLSREPARKQNQPREQRQQPEEEQRPAAGRYHHARDEDGRLAGGRLCCRDRRCEPAASVPSASLRSL